MARNNTTAPAAEETPAAVTTPDAVAADVAATDTTAPAAEETPAAEEVPGTIEAFVLCDCPFGKCGEVVLLNEDQIANGVSIGCIDTNPAAIENAKAQAL